LTASFENTLQPLAHDQTIVGTTAPVVVTPSMRP
jgi:hypothetical protein